MVTCKLRLSGYPSASSSIPTTAFVANLFWEGRFKAWEDRFKTYMGRFQAWEGRFQAWGDERTDKRKTPCVPQDFVSFGAAALLPVTPIHYHAKQGNGYRWPHIALGRPVSFKEQRQRQWSKILLSMSKQGRIHGHQLRTGGQGRKCAFSHFSTRAWRTNRPTNRPTDQPTDGQTDGQSLL